MRWSRIRSFASPLALALALALGAGACNLFIDDWGWEHEPCENEDHCQGDLDCIYFSTEDEFGACLLPCDSEEPDESLECTRYYGRATPCLPTGTGSFFCDPPMEEPE